MKIQVNVYKFKKQNKSKSKKGKFVAYCSLTLDKVFVVKNIKLWESKKGDISVIFPSVERDGEYQSIAFPITKKFREEIVEKIIDIYNDDEDDEDEE